MNLPSFEIELKLLQQRTEARIELGFAIIGLTNRLNAEDAAWRLNEKEAVVHAKYFEQFTQFLAPTYGERRNAGEGLLSTDPTQFPPTSKRIFPDA